MSAPQGTAIASVTAQVSGQVVEISGQAVDISGLVVNVSGQPVNISGVSVSVSGQPVSVSGVVVSISGQVVNVSGISVSVSGQTVVLVSGTNTVIVSGQNIAINNISTNSRFYEVTPALTLASGENQAQILAIDEVNQLAYVGLDMNPGKIAKVDLRTFKEISSLTFNSGEQLPYAGVIDTVNQLLYVGTNTSPAGQVIKVDLKTFTELSTITLLSGDSLLESAVIDTTNNFAYFGTNVATSGRVIRIDLGSFTRQSAIFFGSGIGSFQSAVIDISGQTVYFGNFSEPGVVIAIPIPGFTGIATVNPLNLNAGDGFPISAVIDTTSGFIYWGTASGRVVKTRAGGLGQSEVGSISFTAIGEDTFAAAAIDKTHKIAYFGNDNTSGTIVRVDLNTFTKISPAIIPLSGENNIISAASDNIHGFTYFGTAQIPGKVIKLATIFDSPSPTSVSVSGNIVGTTVSGQVVSLNATSSTNRLYELPHLALAISDNGPPIASAIDAKNQIAYVGAFNSGFTIINNVVQIGKIDLQNFGLMKGVTSLSGNNFLSTAFLDTVNQLLYFGTFTDPTGQIVQYDTTDDALSTATTISLNSGESFIQTSAFDDINNIAYIGCASGKVVKVGLSPFTRLSSLTLLSGEFSPVSMMVDKGRQLLYFATSVTSGKIVKVDLPSLTEIGFIALNSGEIPGGASILDTIHNKAYFGTIGSTAARILKINLDNFTEEQSLLLNSGQNHMISAAFDDKNNFGYFASMSGIIVKVDLTNFTQVDTLSLQPGETIGVKNQFTTGGSLNSLGSPGMIGNDGFLYFAGGGSNTIITSGMIYKIAIQKQDPIIPAVTVSGSIVSVGTDLLSAQISLGIGNRVVLGNGPIISVVVKNRSGNAPITIGGSMNANTYELFANEASPELRVNDLSKVVVQGASGQLVNYIAVRQFL